MANLIIKPTSGGSLILQDEGGSAAMTVAAAGTTTFAESATFSGTTNNLGTVTAGSIAGGAITSATAFPDGHVLSYTGQNVTDCTGSNLTITSLGDIVNSGVTITIASGNRALILISGWSYTHIANYAGSDRHFSLYKTVDGGSETEVGVAWKGGESMRQYERMAVSAMCWDNSVGSILYRIKVSSLGTAGNYSYSTNMFAFELKGSG